MDQTFDVIVIGAGIMGLSSALHCRKAGLNVLLLEQFSYPHTRGSSHGPTRITRKAYLESAEISKMMAEAHELWRQLEKETNSELFLKIGLLYIEPNPAKKLQAIAEVSQRLGYDFTMLDENGLKERYAHSMNFPGYAGLLDNEGGLLRADLCCRKTFELYKSLGGHLIDLAPIKTIKPDSIVEVTTQSGDVYRGKKLIVSAGPWSGSLLKQLNLNLPLKPEAVSVTYWKVKNDAFSPNRFPCFYDIPTNVYAMPAFEYPGLIKLVNPNTNEKGKDPDNRDADRTSQEELMKTYAPYFSEHFPNLETPPAITERCMYTRTPDDMWIIDLHPGHNNIVILAGFSGHGFKAGPLVGKLASELVTGSDAVNRYNLAEFRISRFSGSQ